MSYLARFRVRPGERVKLADRDPSFKDDHDGPQSVAAEIEQCRKRLAELQEMLYVERRRSLLICLRGLDTAGKDGTIKHFLSVMSPQGCTVTQFRHPSAEEASHDFL
jgi:polyphosphate kinase 2 (PPK2 family)